MAFEGLSGKLNQVFKKLKSHGKLTESDVKEAMREVRMALLEADVSYKVVKDFVKKVSERAVGEEVLSSLTPAQQVIKIVNEELCNLMGNENARIQFPSKPPCVIMMCGLQGSGKTTHSAKLAKMLKKGMNPEDFAGYLMIHQYGTCPHGGLGLGLERLTARLLGENNVRETCLFPRDQQRIEP